MKREVLEGTVNVLEPELPPTFYSIKIYRNGSIIQKELQTFPQIIIGNTLYLVEGKLTTYDFELIYIRQRLAQTGLHQLHNTILNSCKSTVECVRLPFLGEFGHHTSIF